MIAADRDGNACPCAPDREIRLADSHWTVWPDVVLRSAGQAADRLDELCDLPLAATADEMIAGRASPVGWETAFADATDRLSAAIRAVATDPWFREAVAWQNPTLLPTCVDKIAAGERRNVRGRNHQSAIANYWQRYTLKNDTIGFFGPLAWTHICDHARGIDMHPGPSVVGRRTVYFENWAIDELASSIAALEGLRDWTRPALVSSYSIEVTRLKRPTQAPLDLAAPHAELAAHADGSRTRRELCRHVADLTGHDPADVDRALGELVDAGVVRSDFEVGVQAHPEHALLSRLAAIDDADARQRAMAPLLELVAHRDRLAAATGHAVADRMAELGSAFSRLTGTAPNRRAGETYAARTIAYLDSTRDVDVRIGSDLIDRIADPLTLLLDSARWLVAEAAANYAEMFLGHWHREISATGDKTVPIAILMATAIREITTVGSVPTPPVAAALAEFQRRWRVLLGLGDTDPARAVRVRDLTELRASAADLFPARPPAWSSARIHSPDLMFATSPTGDDILGVLGELHLSTNTLESRLMVERHPDQARLAARLALDHHGRRIYPIHAKSSPYVTSRLIPPTALPSPDWTYWSWSAGHDSIDVDAPVAAADLDVRCDGHKLVVDLPDGKTVPLLEVLGEVLAPTVLGMFAPVAVAARRPRITLGSLVIAREAWRYAAATVDWIAVRGERDRFLAARAWRRAEGLPERVFLVTPRERKPVAVDFRSIVLVNLMAKAVRAVRDDEGTSFVVSEMLPDAGQLWLADADGRRYTSEIRMVCVDTGAT